jgi:transcriptional regulator with XRE-family HTH domain
MRSLRSAFGLTHEELARRSGLAAVSIAFFESGRGLPTVHDLGRICRGLGVSLALISTSPVVSDYRPARNYRR